MKYILLAKNDYNCIDMQRKFKTKSNLLNFVKLLRHTGSKQRFFISKDNSQAYWNQKEILI